MLRVFAFLALVVLLPTVTAVAIGPLPTWATVGVYLLVGGLSAGGGYVAWFRPPSDARPLDGTALSDDARERILRLAGAFGVDVRAVVTGRFAGGVPAVGSIRAGGRMLLVFTEDLPPLLTSGETEVVFAHELAHFLFRHARRQVLLLSLPCLAALGLLWLCTRQEVLVWAFSHGPWLGTAKLLGLLTAAAAVLAAGSLMDRALSRRQERQALRWSLAVTRNREAYLSSLTKLAGPRTRRAPGWLSRILADHPSLDESIAIANEG